MKHNFVAKHMNSFNKASTQASKKEKQERKRFDKGAALKEYR